AANAKALLVTSVEKNVVACPPTQSGGGRSLEIGARRFIEIVIGVEHYSVRTRYRETTAQGSRETVVDRDARLAERGHFGRFVAGIGDRQHRRGRTDPAMNFAGVVQQGEPENPSCPIRARA